MAWQSRDLLEDRYFWSWKLCISSDRVMNRSCRQQLSVAVKELAALGLGRDPASPAGKCMVQCWGAWESGLEHREETEVEAEGKTERRLVSWTGESEEK